MCSCLGREGKHLPCVSLSATRERASHVHTQRTLYIFYLKSLKLNTQQCFSLEFHFRNANALGPDTRWFISSFIFAHICLCPCVCLLLIPPFFQPACLSWDLGLPHLPLSAPWTHMLVCMHIHKAHAHVDGGWEHSAALTVAVLDATLTSLLSALLGPSNSVCSRPCTEVSALTASTICVLSQLDSEHCGGALLGAIESDLIPTLAFCQQRLHSDKCSGSSGQTNLLLYVSRGQISMCRTGWSFVFLVRNRYE